MEKKVKKPTNNFLDTADNDCFLEKLEKPKEN